MEKDFSICIELKEKKNNYYKIMSKKALKDSLKDRYVLLKATLHSQNNRKYFLYYYVLY